MDGYHYYISSNDTYLVNPANESDKSHTVTTAAKELIFCNNGYWLASKGVFAYSYCAFFGPGYVTHECSKNGFLFGGDGRTADMELPIRAVVSLRSDIPEAVV